MEAVEIGPGGVPKGSRTSQYYRTFGIPERFEHPGKCCFVYDTCIFTLRTACSWYHSVILCRVLWRLWIQSSPSTLYDNYSGLRRQTPQCPYYADTLLLSNSKVFKSKYLFQGQKFFQEKDKMFFIFSTFCKVSCEHGQPSSNKSFHNLFLLSDCSTWEHVECTGIIRSIPTKNTVKSKPMDSAQFISVL